MKKLILALPFLFPFAAEAACPTTSLTFKDAAGATQTLCFGGASGAYIPQYAIMDAGGTNLLGITSNSAAKIEGVGVAGTPAGGVASIQGVASGTPVPISAAS